jgi:hypothetical protein
MAIIFCFAKRNFNLANNDSFDSGETFSVTCVFASTFGCITLIGKSHLQRTTKHSSKPDSCLMSHSRISHKTAELSSVCNTSTPNLGVGKVISLTSLLISIYVSLKYL